MDELNKNDEVLARDARIIFEKLGPTYIKMGQMMSVRPDVLPPAALKELSILQVRYSNSDESLSPVVFINFFFGKYRIQLAQVYVYVQPFNSGVDGSKMWFGTVGSGTVYTPLEIILVHVLICTVPDGRNFTPTDSVVVFVCVTGRR